MLGNAAMDDSSLMRAEFDRSGQAPATATEDGRLGCAMSSTLREKHHRLLDRIAGGRRLLEGGQQDNGQCRLGRIRQSIQKNEFRCHRCRSTDLLLVQFFSFHAARRKEYAVDPG